MFEPVMVDVIKNLAAFAATEDRAHLAQARKALARYEEQYGNGSRDFEALWRVTISLQRHICDIGVEHDALHSA